MYPDLKHYLGYLELFWLQIIASLSQTKEEGGLVKTLRYVSLSTRSVWLSLKKLLRLELWKLPWSPHCFPSPFCSFLTSLYEQISMHYFVTLHDRYKEVSKLVRSCFTQKITQRDWFSLYFKLGIPRKKCWLGQHGSWVHHGPTHCILSLNNGRNKKRKIVNGHMLQLGSIALFHMAKNIYKFVMQ